MLLILNAFRFCSIACSALVRILGTLEQRNMERKCAILKFLTPVISSDSEKSYTISLSSI